MTSKTLGLILMVVGFSVLAMVGVAAFMLLPTLSYLHTHPMNVESARFVLRTLEWILFAALPVLSILVILGGMAAAGLNRSKKPGGPRPAA